MTFEHAQPPGRGISAGVYVFQALSPCSLFGQQQLLYRLQALGQGTIDRPCCIRLVNVKYLYPHPVL